MLPFRVIQLEQYRALQQSAAKPCVQQSSPLSEISSERNFATRSRQLSGSFSQGDFAASVVQNTLRPTLKNEGFLAKWAPTSNRFWGKNRSHRKQTIKPCLTGSRFAHKEFRESAKTNPIFDLFFPSISGAKSRGIA
jgi:hypothetical protein